MYCNARAKVGHCPLLFLALSLTWTPVASRAQTDPAAPPPPAAAPAALQDRVESLEALLRSVTTRLDKLEESVKELKNAPRPAPPQGVAASPKFQELEKKIEQLKKQLVEHTHEYLVEGINHDGGVEAVRPEDFMNRGLNQTGKFRIGRAILSQ